MTRAFILILALIAGPVFAEKPSSGLTNVRGFNHTTSLDNSIGPRGHSGPWLKYEGCPGRTRPYERSAPQSQPGSCLCRL
jgi:hypothetical protein